MSDDGNGFSPEERAAIKRRIKELRLMKGLKGSAKKAREYEAYLATIDALRGTDRAIAETLHLIVMEEAPELDPRTWYGFPAYAKDGKVVLFYQPAERFNLRYGSVGFQEEAALDEGDMWPVAYAITAVTPKVEAELRNLIRRAAGRKGEPTLN